jgi:hypothetical protein
MSAAAEPVPKFRPLNRGMNAVIGACLIMALFALAGPLLGVAVAFGVLGLIGGVPAGFLLGFWPAVLTGAAFVALWVVGSRVGTRYLITTLVGALASVIIPALQAVENVGLWVLLFPAGVIASFACTYLAERGIKAVERGRAASADPAAG